jgi:hypothetical protein
MKSHPRKCPGIDFSNRGQPTKIQYSIHYMAVPMKKATVPNTWGEGGGVTIHNKLNRNEHISNIKTNTTKTLGFIKKNLQDFKPPIEFHGLLNKGPSNIGVRKFSLGPIPSKSGIGHVRCVEESSRIRHRYLQGPLCRLRQAHGKSITMGYPC